MLKDILCNCILQKLNSVKSVEVELDLGYNDHECGIMGPLPQVNATPLHTQQQPFCIASHQQHVAGWLQLSYKRSVAWEYVVLLVENCTSSLHFLHAGDEERLPIVFPINIAMVSPHCQPVNGTIDKISRKPSKYTCDKGYCICS